MRVVITTAGSLGDVAPYTGLAARLDRAGHNTVIATHEPFRRYVEERGIAFAPLAGDPRELMGTEAGQQWQRSGSSLRATLQLVRLMRPYAVEMAERTLAATEGADVILCSALTAAGWHTAKGRRIPSMGVYLAPLERTRDFSSVLAGGTRSYGPWGNRLSGTIAEGTLAVPFRREINDARAKLGLPPTSYRRVRREQAAERWPVLHGFSPHVVPRPQDWRPGLEVVGFWWPEPDPAWTPPADLLEFLAAGPPPVFLGFGSMAAGTGDEERLADVAVQALRAVGARGVVQAGWSGLTVEGDDVLSVGEVPHEWLFPRMAAVVHHAGVGTSAAAVRHGIPAVPVPVLADQPFWAARLHRIGVAAEPIPFSRLTSENLAAALTEVLHRPSYATTAQRLAAGVAQEDGTGAVVEALERL